MSKYHLALFVVLFVVVLGANLLPLHRGEPLACRTLGANPAKRATVFGFPIGIYTTTGTASSDGCAIYETQAAHVFSSAGLWLDALVDGVLLGGAYYVLADRSKQ